MTTQEKPVVSREMVFAESDRMKADGVEPTNRKLLNELGGSMTTIAGFLREWRAQQSIAAPADTEVVEVPAMVAEAGTAAVAAIWKVCHAEARREIETITDQANQRIQAVSADRDNVLGELEQADGELNIARTSVVELTAALDALRVEFGTMQSLAIGRESASAATIEQMAHQIEAQASELVRVHEDLIGSRQAHTAELGRLTGDYNRQLNEQAEALRLSNDEAARLRSKLDDEASKLATAAGEREVLREQVKRHEADHATLRAEMSALRAEVTDGARQLASTAGECDALRSQVKSQLEVISSFATKPGTVSGEAPQGLTRNKRTQKRDN